MNLILVGGAFLGAMLLTPNGPDPAKAPVEATVSQPVQQAAKQPVQKAAEAPVSEERGWMTRELSVDRKTGETTEISVIGFAD